MKNIKYLTLVLHSVLSASVLCTVVTPSLSQNLVPNPSFESVNCPTTYTGFASQIETQVADWYSGNCASPDVMTDCSDHSHTRIPGVWYGWQHAHTGSNYLAFSFYMIGSIPWYEYLGVELESPMVAGQAYEVSFWLSRADSVRYATDEIGVYFSSKKDGCEGGFAGPVLPYTPQVNVPSGTVIDDTSGWVKVSGTYLATGGESHLLIGCFSPWDSMKVEDVGHGMARCYYYLDDVSVKEGVTSIDKDLASSFTFWPNPASQVFRMKRKVAHDEARISIRDLQGRLIYQEKMDRGEMEISVKVADWTKGVYVAKIDLAGGDIFKKVLVR